MAQKTQLELSIIVKQQQLKEYMKKILSARPRVFVPELNITVDGGYHDLFNLENGQKLGVLFIKDADDVFHDILLSDWDYILNAIRLNGLNTLQFKWNAEAVLNNPLVTQAEVDAIVIPGL